jgi:S1-C subfamily serine protease
MKTAVTSLFAAIAGALAVLAIQPVPNSLSASTQQDAGPVPTIPARPIQQLIPAPPRVYNADGLAPDEAVAAYTYDVNNRCVANIATRIGGARIMFRQNPTSDAGSGFVIDQQGHLLTNYHVIENAQRIQVTLFNGESFEAERVGVDPINDMAVIRINAPAELLFPVRFGSSSNLRVGMTVFAIGNPFGLERTMTTGIISSLNRTLPVTRARSIKSVIQIDAAINPGNSGGPLLNSHGELIGMNTAIASSTGQNSGIGFAIPVNLIARVVPELIEHGKVIRPDLGIIEVLRTEQGLRILLLDPNGAAVAAGLQGPEIKRIKRGLLIFEAEDRSKADVIVGVNGKKTLKADEFLFEVESHHPGDTISIEVIRGGRTVSVPVQLR